MSLEKELKRVFKDVLLEIEQEKNTTTVTPGKFVALISQLGTNPIIIEELKNTTGIVEPISSVNYKGVGLQELEIAIPIFNKKHTLSIGSPSPQSTNGVNEKTLYNLIFNSTNKVELRSYFNGGGTNDIFQLSDNKIKKVKLELEIFE